MKIIFTNDPAFKNLLACFQEFPAKVPGSSIMVVDENKPIMLLCLYFDADVFFIHGLFKSRTSTIREFLKAIRVAEKFMGENVFGKFPVISFTTKNTIKKFLLKNKFKREEITMLVRGIQ